MRRKAPAKRTKDLNVVTSIDGRAAKVAALDAPLLRVTGVRKSYATPQGPLEILKGVDLSLEPRATTALMGESGSGKSTLLHLIAGLDDADAGEVLLDGRSFRSLSDVQRAKLRRETLGVVFQQFNLIASLNVADNLAFQARLAGRFDRGWQEELTARLRLEALAHRYPEQLSGGQQQRVAIGRALAARPRLLLADEPTGNLDEASGDEMLQLALDLVAATGCAFLMVTHSARLAARLEQRLVLSSGVVVKP
jgi:putative ABC transport system ATP-binding protein